MIEPQDASALEGARHSKSRSRSSLARRMLSWMAKAWIWPVFLVAILALWQAIVTVGGFKEYLLPGPAAVWQATEQYPGLILWNCWVTVYESLIGFALAVIVGLLLAITIVFVPAIKQVIVPTVVGLNTLPKVALAPILVVLLGLGANSKVAMAMLLAFFPIFINEVGGLDDVEPTLLEYLQLLKASRLQTLLFARLPNSVPVLLDGMKIALSLAVVGAIVGEFIASSEGLGYQITLAYSTQDTPLVFALVIVVSIAAAALYFGLVVIERLLFWPFAFRRQGR